MKLNQEMVQYFFEKVWNNALIQSMFANNFSLFIYTREAENHDYLSITGNTLNSYFSLLCPLNAHLRPQV